jgi:hypothetical protein
MSTPPILDLSGAFYAQKSYLLDLQNRPVIDANVAGSLTTMSKNIDKLYSNFQQASGTSSAVLDNQKNMQEIVNTELKRLNTKKQSVDAALDGQNRMIQLNDSYRQKYSYYVSRMIIIIIFLIIYIIISSINKNFKDIPQIIFDILYIILAVSLITIIFYSIINIKDRDNLNFSELNYASPNIPLSGKELEDKQKSALKSGDLYGSINVNGCIGNDCCSEGTVWNQEKLVCVGANGFTSMNDSNCNNILSNYASEKDKYAFI